MKISSMLLIWFAARLALAATPSIDPNLYLSEVKYLASPELRGRATGSPELEKAAAFIAGKFRGFGLKGPAGNDYFQPFQATTATKLGKANRLQFKENSHTTNLQSPGGFIPFNFSGTGKWSGSVVFAGYGITAPQQSYDDYAGIDAKGKVVLLLQHEPQEFDERSVFAGKNFTMHAEFFSKASNAKQHGAVGVILIADRANHPDKPEELQRFGTADGPTDAGIPFVQVKAAEVANWFSAAGKNLETLMREIDQDLKPRSFAFPDSIRVTAETDLTREVKAVRNVAAYLPGETGEYVIIGAHYD